MIKNYFKLTVRNLMKNRVSSIINLLGLTVGISTCIIIFLFINNELSFDDFNTQADRIYRVVTKGQNASGVEYEGSVPSPMAAVLMNDLPDLKHVTQIYQPSSYQVSFNEDKWTQADIAFADSAFFNVFDYELIATSKKHLLRSKGEVILTESLANDHFDGKNALGKIFKLNQKEDVQVVGIMKDLPVNSHLQFKMLVSYPTLSEDFVGLDIFSWDFNGGIYNYVVLPENGSERYFNDGLLAVRDKYKPVAENSETLYYLQPLKDIHFNQTFAKDNFTYTMDSTYVWVLGFIGVFILVIACVNFINLSTALAIKRAKEVGMRKVLGASKSQLALQYLSEAFLITLTSALLSLGIVERVMPFVNHYMSVSLSISAVTQFEFIVFYILLVLAVTLLSGLYPSIILASYQPAKALKTKITDVNTTSLFLRKGLVGFQFVVSQVLIIATLVIASQMDYFHSKPLGFKQDEIVILSLPTRDEGRLETFKNELLKSNMVNSVSFALGAPTSSNNLGSNFRAEGDESNMNAQIKAVDIDYKTTYGLEMAAGNWFTHIQKGEEGYELIVNESMTRKIGFSSPNDAIGENIQFGINGIDAPIVGVVEDFHMASLEARIEPLIMCQFPPFYFEGGVRVGAGNLAGAMAHIEKSWASVFPEYVYDYEFLDEVVSKNYDSEQTIFNLFKILAGIAIAIGCLGLIGLVSFLVTQKSKEVGVRKVLGASVSSIFLLFGKGYMILLLIAFLIAAPITWWAMDGWLSSFAYKIELSPLYFLVGILINGLIAVLTVGFQSIKAAMANPVDSLKDD
ncbi:ABC transporter permease [Fulvivirga sediminis]|uniref:ABC transporter permease n=1 Tax=Fulvivirga sediminis TaxID=2803949 RepID=A0A937FDA4_9BACT|nr:ABC transporter permease [Fulvivirga sediminis]MBL3658308.1 ABC transporter permease [Fulvivirga sediminis]